MHITVVCPGCKTSYQLSPSMRGQQMSCPKAGCRTTFTVQDSSAPPPPPPPPTHTRNQRSGSVGDMVPILSAEAAVPPQPETPHSQTAHVSEMVPLIQAEIAAPPPKPTEPQSWRQAPPPRRSPAVEPVARPTAKPPVPPKHPAPTVVQTPELRAIPIVDEPSLPPPGGELRAIPVGDEPNDPAGPVILLSIDEEANGAPSMEPIEVPAGQWDQPPPVRRGAGAAVALQPETHPEYHPTVVTKSRLSLVLMAFIVVGMILLLGGGGVVTWFVLRDTEEKLLKRAQQDYQEHKYRSAANLYQDLYDKFPASGRRSEYAYLRKLCELRDRLGTQQRPAAETFDDLEKFLADNKNDPALKQYAADFSEAATKVLLDFTEQPAGDDTAPAVVAKAEKLLGDIKAALGDAAIKTEDAARLAKAFPAMRKRYDDWEARAAIVKQVEKLADTPTAGAIREAEDLLKKAEARLPGISQSPDVTRLLAAMRDNQFAKVDYIPATDQPKLPPPEEQQSCILVNASTGRGTAGLQPGKHVLALARGVLYALNRDTGQADWAMRVGLDTTTPPVRVPAAAGVPELILVLSADTETLTALNENGEDVWRYRLSKPCLGRPLIVDQRAFLPTYDGQVHEIDLLKGQLIGRYQLGQRLTRGGVRQPRTPLVYFPADDSCVYVLNVDTKKCEAILYSDHPAGSLRGEPLIVGASNAAGDPGGWLILNQTQGLDSVQLRVFELPVKPGATGEVKLQRPPILPGWTWFPPHHDGEKLAMLSDAGTLGLFGIRQVRNRDPALFPWLPGSDAWDLGPFLHAPTKVRGRSEVVQVQGNDIWVLANGRLQRLQLVWDGMNGLTALPAWKEPIGLGSPLHPSWVENNPLKGSGTIFLTTQGLLSRTCLATAVDDENGEIYWQRQLGLVCQGEPLLLRAADDKGPPLLLALDQGGALFAFDPQRFDRKPGDQRGGQRVAVPLEQNLHVPPLLLRGDDGASAFEIACPGDGKELVVRHVYFVEQRKLQVDERRVQLDYRLEGTPVVAGQQLILPLADGNLWRLFWKQAEKGVENVEEWRTDRGTSEAVGHVASLGNERFLCTYGSRGLNVFQAGEKSWTLLPRSAVERPSLELKDRLVAPPLVLSSGKKNGSVDVCVADARGVVSLLSVDANGSLIRRREWKLGGRITAGPFVRRQDDTPRIGGVVGSVLPAVQEFLQAQGEGLRIGCIVDRRRLVWIDPQQDAVCWEHSAAGAIVGQPEVADRLLVIADQSGRFTALDPRTGEKEGPGHALRGSIAPAAAPVSFGPNRLFAPLSDGTVLLLSLDQLRQP
jgi:PQQ-like domain